MGIRRILDLPEITSAGDNDYTLIVKDGETKKIKAAKIKGTSAEDEIRAIDYNGGILNSTTISAAITSISSDTKTLVITPGTWTLISSVTIPSNITLKLQAGAILSRSSGTLTINGPISFPRQKCLQGFIPNTLKFGGMVNTLYIDWTEAAGDGITDDSLPIYAILNATSNCTIEFSPKIYLINTVQYANKKNQIIHLNDATLRAGTGLGENWSFILNIGSFKTWTVGTMQPTVITKNVNHFTLPTGITINVDDTFFIYDKDTYIPGYSYGVLATVTKISGGEVYFDNFPDYTFTADSISIMNDVSGIEIDGGTFDNATNSFFCGGLNLSGKNFKVKNVKAYGDSTKASIGIAGIVINAEISNCIIRDYICSSGIPVAVGGGRQGDGIAITGINATIHDNVISNCKHLITLSRREFITNNITIYNNTLTQDKSFFGQLITKQDGGQEYYFGGAMDTHADAENILIMGNTIESAGQGVINVRNGKQVVIGNKLRLLNGSASGCGIINFGESILVSVHMSDNDIDADADGTPIISSYDGIGIANQKAIKLSNNNISSRVVWKGCQLRNNRLYNTSAPTSFTWEQGDEVWNINPTLGAPLLWRCVTGGTPGTWETISMSSMSVSDAAYSSSWNNDATTAPSKNAIYDKIESLVESAGLGDVIGPASVTDNYIPQWDGTTGNLLKNGLQVGTGPNNIVQLDANSKLPALNASNLTSLPNINSSTYSITTTDVTATNPLGIYPWPPNFANSGAYTNVDISCSATTSTPNSGSFWRLLSSVPQYAGSGTGANAFPEINAFFASPRNTGSGKVNTLNGLHVWMRNTGATGTVGTMNGVYIKTPTSANSTGGSITSIAGVNIESLGVTGANSAFGIYISDQSGANSNYAIYTGAGKVRFGDAIIMATSAPPASSTATGTTGQIAWDSNYIYVCTATNTWKRTALATW